MKRCPFCASNVLNYYYSERGGKRVSGAIKCEVCGAYGPNMNTASGDAVIASWNIRRLGKRTQAIVIIAAFLASAASTASALAFVFGPVGFCGGLSVFSAVFLWKAVAAMRGDKE